MLRALIYSLVFAFPLSISAAEWHYTDGAGTSVTLPAPPQRIIAHANVAAALIPLGIKPIGILRDGPPSLDKSLSTIDIADIPIVSAGWFEIDAEAILALDPDLIVTEYSLSDRTYQGGTHEGAIGARIASIAPVIGIASGDSVLELLARYEDFAASIAPTPASVSQDKAEFETARTDFVQALTEKPDLVFLAGSASRSSFTIAKASDFAELADFQFWGAHFLEPVTQPGTNYLSVSWENTSDYRADIILFDDRWESDGLATAQANTMGARMPAIAAGQTGAWPAGWIRSYAVYAQELEKLTALIARSEKL